MFYIDDVLKRTRNPYFKVLQAPERQVILTGNDQPMGAERLFSNGKVLKIHDFNVASGEFETVADNMYLVSGKGGGVQRMLGNMFGVKNVEFERPEGMIR